MIPWEPSAIDSPQARRGIENALRIKGTKTVPEAVNTGGIQFTYEMGAGGYLAPTFQLLASSDISVAAVASASLLAIGPTGFTFAGALGTSLLTLDQQNARVLACALRLDFNGAGAAAFAGKVVNVAYTLRDFDNSPNMQILNEDFTIAAATLGYRRNLNASFWKGLVPLNMAFTVDFTSVDGTVFPAATTARVSLQVARAGVGVELPN